MSLVSRSFRANRKLQRCLVSDPDHVTPGARGDHVKLIQGALISIVGAKIGVDELALGIYGKTTAAAVLQFKSVRKIINFKYQTTPDNIVGKMTIRALDAEMVRRERKAFRLLLAAGVPDTTPRTVILTEPVAHAQIWAAQFAKAQTGVVVHPAPGNKSVPDNVVAIKRAIAAARGGMLIFNVGHGLCNAANFKGNLEEGAFDIAPNGAMRIEGKNMESDPSQFVNVFYDDAPPKPPGGGIVPKSDRQLDREGGRNQARRDRFDIYEDISRSFAAGGLAAVVLATCRVGRAAGLLTKVAQQWKTPIIAYKDQWMFYETPSRRTRAIMAGDKGKEIKDQETLKKDPKALLLPHTDNPQGEIFFPLTLLDMAIFR